MTSLLKTFFGLSLMLPFGFARNHTQCVDNGLNWYTSVVGETPCRTYERLRQICNNQYVLGALIPKTRGAPPDTCDDKIADCCCNSIAFGLSMMCLICQQGVLSGSVIGAVLEGVGAYERYLKHGTNFFCSPNTNRSFTIGIQAAVCENHLKIHNDFYETFWDDGSWYYDGTLSREKMEKPSAADGNDSFTHCPSTAMNITSSSQSRSISSLESTPSSLSHMVSPTESATKSTISGSTLPRPSNSLSAGAIAGIAIGCIAFLGVIALFYTWLVSYRRRRADIEDSETSPTPFIISDDRNTAFMAGSSAGIPMLTRNPEPGAGRRLRMKEQRGPPPRYAE